MDQHHSLAANLQVEMKVSTERLIVLRPNKCVYIFISQSFRSKEGKIETTCSLSGKSEIVAIVYITCSYSVMFSTLCKFRSICLGGGILKTTNLCFPKQKPTKQIYGSE